MAAALREDARRVEEPALVEGEVGQARRRVGRALVVDLGQTLVGLRRLGYLALSQLREGQGEQAEQARLLHRCDFCSAVWKSLL